MAARTLITLPGGAKRGDVVEVRALLQHPMETGYRNDSAGVRLPRDIVTRFTCRLAGEVVFEAELFPAISANPYLAFSLRVDASGPLEFAWEGDNGFAHRETRQLDVA